MVNLLKLFSVIPILIFLVSPVLYAQDKCGTVEYQKMLHPHNPDYKQNFENWLEKRIEEKTSKDQNGQRQEETEEIVTIPVVVHIIHNGELYGTGINITDDQIRSQIDVLNEDFTRTNADQSNTPVEFIAVAANADVNFVLAKRDPEGLPTDGIVRVQGSKSSWTFNVGDDDRALKAHSYWPAEDYLNIWVTESSWLGWAQFPVSDLDGMEDASNNRLTDGVVIDYQSFGSIEKYPAATDLKSRYALGRTTTHEIGHFLGLNHIWGDDGGCNDDDYCADTPTASSENFTKECTFPGPNSCTDSGIDFPDMFQNYMDYSDDACMNLFTLDQKSRIVTVLENSPRRKSLTTSKGGVAPVIVENDLGIKSIVSPNIFNCSSTVIPQLEIRNYGKNDATQVTIETLLDDILIQTSNFGFELNYLDIIYLNLDEIALADKSKQDISFRIKSTNNTTDGNNENDLKSLTLISSPEASLPISETFDIVPDDWQFYSPEGGFNWEMTRLSYKSQSDSSIMLNCFNYDIIEEQTFLLSPHFDLFSSEFASLTFEIAHSNFAGYTDELKIIVSTDCGNTFPESNTIYSKSGDELRTTSFSWTSEFIPTSSKDWRLEQVDLSAFAGKNIQIGIIGVNGYGNNIFLDNIRVITTKLTDISVNTILSPSPVLGINEHDFAFEVLNLGSKTITSFDYTLALNEGAVNNFNIDGISMLPGQSYTIEHGEITGIDGLNRIDINIDNPNDTIDINLDNNSLSYYYTVDHSKDIIPLRVSFETSSNFVSNSQFPNEVNWEYFTIGNNTTLQINGAEHPHNNAQEWLVSPTLDLSNTQEASMYFDVSYALPNSLNSDFLQILISENDGLSYTQSTYSKSGMTLATTAKIEDNWLPTSSAEWRRDQIDLTDFASKENVRVAFVFYNKNANALYLDNVEFYIDSIPDTLSRSQEFVIGPNPIQPDLEDLNLYFELEDRQPVVIALYNQTGQLLYKEEFSSVLNQHYQLPLDDLPAGLVILRAIGETFQHTERIVVIK